MEWDMGRDLHWMARGRAEWKARKTAAWIAHAEGQNGTEAKLEQTAPVQFEILAAAIVVPPIEQRKRRRFRIESKFHSPS